MIPKIALNASQLNQAYQKKENSTFKGMDFITKALVKSDAAPMIGISIIDLTSMIVPRTIIDATRNGFAATETFLRESSGLIINCLTPSLVVFGVAFALKNLIMDKEFKSIPAHKIWANQASIDTISNAWLITKGTKEERTASLVTKLLDNLEGLVGKNDWKKLSELPEKETHYKAITNAILKNDQKAVDVGVNGLIEKFGASRNIRFADSKTKLSCTLKEFTRDMKDLTTSFASIADNKIPAFTKNLTKLVGVKSLLGLGVIFAIGSTFQMLNRKMTKKRTGHDGFVGDPNFGQVDKNKAPKKKELSEKDKKDLKVGKLISLAGLATLLVASFGKRPSLKMFQFNGIFPTMNQCRLISAFTFGGRILASEDKNELRETSLRDYLGFINLYLLGDYIAKGFATAKEKMNPEFKGKLLNETEARVKDAGIFKRAWHWIRNVELKGFEEVANDFDLKRARGHAQAASILYSCIALGIAIPLFNKYHTNKKVKEKEMSEQISLSKTTTSLSMTGGLEKHKEIYSSFIK